MNKNGLASYHWKLADCGSEHARQLAGELRIPLLLAQCLANRGCEGAEAASRYLEPRLAHLNDPFLLPGMTLAVDRLLQARANNERVVVFGDYDVDGVTSTALLTEFFREFGWQSEYYLPHRMEEGYGLSREAMENCLQRFPTTLMVAVDCGSSANEVIQELNARKVDLIVVDHHQVSSPAPPALALVNPQLGTDADARNLCSVGLAFKLAHALLKRGRALGWANAAAFDLREFLDFVGLGTIADLVPLKGENRIFARAGLEKLRATKRPGVVALKKVSGVNGSLGCHEVGFQLGPRLNAAGRLETALDALELLLTRDTERADTLAGALDEQNRQRQAIERTIADEAIGAVRARFNPETDFAIVEGRATWHLGVVGIVASRVLREFYRPVVILGSDGSEAWRGSGRSIDGFDLAASLRNCGDLLMKCGGHAMAAGVTMASTRLDDFRAKLNELARTSLGAEALQPSLRLDGEVQLSEMTFDTLKALGRVQPVGQGNPPVQFFCRGLRVRGESKCGGQSQHRRITVTDGRVSHQAMWWNCDPELRLPEVFDLAFAPELSEYNGTFAIQLRVLDCRPSA